MCNKGRRQSPIDISPDKLLFDPDLVERHLHIDKHKVDILYDFVFRKMENLSWDECLFFCNEIVSSLQVSGTLYNTGQSLVFRVDKNSKHHVNISGGPLDYKYQFEEIYIHYGIDNNKGSEHQIHGYSFPGEVSFFSYHFFVLHIPTSQFSKW